MTREEIKNIIFHIPLDKENKNMSNLPFLLNEEKLSRWCYKYCLNIKDDPEVRKYITHSYWVKRYNKFMKGNI